MGDCFLFLSAQDGQIVAMVSGCFAGIPAHGRGNPWRSSVGTQWETCGKTQGYTLNPKARPQKKVLSLVLCVAMLLSVMVMGTGAASFTDQDEFSDNYAEAAEVLTGMGIIQGYDDGSFLPQRNINRAQVATMIYRAATGDVTDSKISQFVGEDLFDDVNADDWFAGYVNYCGNAEYIKGFTPDTFGPYKQVTGYQVLAMILRAVGYDENDEYTGDQWTLRVAATAREQGLLDNLNPDTNLAEPATRELVAELIFQAIHPDVDTVHYVPAEGEYQSDDGTSLGEQVFKLKVDNSADEWGRPEGLWTYNTGDEETVIEIAPVATYTTAVAQCDVYEDTGISGDVAAYVNSGRWNDTYNISKTATKDNIGAQGQLVEVYDYTTVDGKDATRIVVIDTFLAQVTNVTEAKYDSNNHLAKDASLTLTVYDGANTSVTLTNGSTNYTYAVGDMLLINAYTNDKDEVISGDGQYVEIVSAAESFVGAQTTIHYNANTHTINGTEYNDAYKFIRDDAGTREDYNLNWWLDQYGNVIGATAIADNYAVLKDMIWIDGRPGYAEATLVYMDGTEATVTVDSIDGNYRNDETHFGWWTNNDTTPALNDAQWVGFFGDNANVSSNSNYNGLYEGYALYRVDTNSDGSVNLEGIESYVSDWLMVIHYVDNATLNANRTALTNNGRVVTQLSNDTAILVKNGDTYTACSRADLPTINWETAEVFYSDADNNGIAENVYVKSYSSITGDYIFPTSNAARLETTTWGVIVEGVYIDGELTEVATTEEIAKQLIDNRGKLFRITDWVVNHDTPAYGMLNGVNLVNEDNDNERINRDVNYLENVDQLKYTGGLLYVNQSLAYDVTDTVEVIYQNEPYTMTLADAVAAIQKDKNAHGIWVEGDANGDAAIVYVGTRLNEDSSITVTPDNGLVADKDNPDNSTYTYTINDMRDNGKLSIDVKADGYGAELSIKDKDGESVSAITNVKAGDTYTVTVTTECNGDCSSETWTIEITDGWNMISNAVPYIRNGQNNAQMAKDVNVYFSFEDAIKAENIKTVYNDNTYQDILLSLDKDVLTGTALNVVPFTDANPSEAGFEAATKTEVVVDTSTTTWTAKYTGVNKLENTTIVVVELTARDPANPSQPAGNVYFAFQMDN